MLVIRISFTVLLVILVGACAGDLENGNELPVKCVDKPDPGPCTGQQRRFWYDYQTNGCRMFLYGGCGGHVPFETREACEVTCLDK